MRKSNNEDVIVVESRKRLLKSRRMVRKMEFKHKILEKMSSILLRFPVSTWEKREVYDMLEQSKNFIDEAKIELAKMELLYAMLSA